MILMIDNYDSFTYNLVQEISEISGAEVVVVRNDQETVEQLLGRQPQAVVISPGPGEPSQAGVTLELVRAAAELPLLGICLGHQALAMAHGARVVRAPEPVHGKTSQIFHRRQGVFCAQPMPVEATRYHSLVVDADSLGPELSRSAWTEDGLVMGLSHRTRPHHGVQFHPESYLSRHGRLLLAAFLELAGVPLLESWRLRLQEGAMAQGERS